MDKRYQVFVSSTFVDLQDERQEVMQALLELDCIPSGMELFPAADEDQWSIIKKVIDDSDYYVLVIGGRYGSLSPDGMGYTEMEYRYATEIGKPIMRFVHRNPGSLPADKCEVTDAGKQKLADFRAHVQTKTCRHWETAADLGSQVSRSLVKLIKANPAVGWVRGNQVPSEGALEEILSLRRRIEELQQEINSTRTQGPQGSEMLAQGTENFTIDYKFSASQNEWDIKNFDASMSMDWDEIFFAVSPHMIDEASDATLLHALNSMLLEEAKEIYKDDEDLVGHVITHVDIAEYDFLTIKVQLRALGLIAQSLRNRGTKVTGTFWTLTPYGDTVMTRLRAIPKRSESSLHLEDQSAKISAD